jgi:hypothetical protein
MNIGAWINFLFAVWTKPAAIRVSLDDTGAGRIQTYSRLASAAGGNAARGGSHKTLYF